MPPPTPISRHVAAVPYPGRGHVNPMLILCRRLLSTSDSLLVSFVVTEEWLSLIAASGDPPPPANLRFVTIPNCIPSEIGRAGDFWGFLDAVYTKMGEPFEEALDRMEAKVDAIVADTYLPWAVAAGNRRNIPVYSLFPMSATFFLALYGFEKIPADKRKGPVRTDSTGGEADEPLGKYIPGHNALWLSDINDLLRPGTPIDRALEAFSMVRRAQGVLFTSCYELETQVIDALREDLHCPVLPVGPSIPYMFINDKPASSPNNSELDYIGWLDLQPKQSVLYVSLGSFLSVSGKQMDEIAVGLRLSGVKFLWVARGDSMRLEELVGGAGKVLPWCDQLKVLSHPSIGGFLTHCGWNSTMEGAFCGVPMLTFPIFWDQLVDSRVVVDEWKTGLSLKQECGKEGTVGGEEISSIVKRLMDSDDSESKGMRTRAEELRNSVLQAVEDDGSSSKNIDSFVRVLLQGIV